MGKQNYNNIIFDLGGVIVNLNTQSTLEAFANLSGFSIEDIHSKFLQEPAFFAYERGQISDNEFREAVREVMNLKVQDDAIDQAWNAMIFDIPAHRLQWLSSLNKQHDVYILSNTNTIHINYVHGELLAHHQLNNFATLVKEVYYSHEVGMRKPDGEIFDWVLDKNGLKPEETVFLDDNLVNIKGAQEAGIVSLQVNAPEDVPQLLRNEGIEI